MRSVAWVTGGGTGIGRALASQCRREGYDVAISGRRADILTQAATELEKEPGEGRVLPLPGDASRPIDVERAHTAIRQQLGEVDLLINNAGTNSAHTFQHTDPQEYIDNFSVNCISAILCTRAVMPAMLQRRQGTVVNISSIAGKWASANASAYSVSKYALTGFTDALRQELQGTGVHVMGVFPGYIRTPMIMDRITPGSMLERIAVSPESMAAAIARGIRGRKRVVQYPWYVPLLLKSHEWLPGPMESLLRLFKV